MKRPHAAPATPEPQTAVSIPAPTAKDDTKEKLKAAQDARRAAEQRADELAKQLSTATLEIMRLKAEIYDLHHGLA